MDAFDDIPSPSTRRGKRSSIGMLSASNSRRGPGPAPGPSRLLPAADIDEMEADESVEITRSPITSKISRANGKGKRKESGSHEEDREASAEIEAIPEEDEEEEEEEEDTQPIRRAGKKYTGPAHETQSENGDVVHDTYQSDDAGEPMDDDGVPMDDDVDAGSDDDRLEREAVAAEARSEDSEQDSEQEAPPPPRKRGRPRKSDETTGSQPRPAPKKTRVSQLRKTSPCAQPQLTLISTGGGSVHRRLPHEQWSPALPTTPVLGERAL